MQETKQQCWELFGLIQTGNEIRIIVLLSRSTALLQFWSNWANLSAVLCCWKLHNFDFLWRWKWRCDYTFFKADRIISFLLMTVHWNMPLGTELAKLTHSAIAWRTCLPAWIDCKLGKPFRYTTLIFTKVMQSFTVYYSKLQTTSIWLILISRIIKITVRSVDILKPSSKFLLMSVLIYYFILPLEL